MSILEDERFCQLVEETQHKWAIPGISVSVVDLAQGISNSKGFVLPGTGVSLSENTLLPIASNTKLFTVVALGILIEEGKLPSWDSKMCDLLPDWQLQDEYTSRTITLAEILSHQSGIVG